MNKIIIIIISMICLNSCEQQKARQQTEQFAPQQTKIEIKSDLKSLSNDYSLNKNIMIFFMTDEKAQMLSQGDNELYADWSYYLNNFKMKDLSIYKISEEQGKNYFKDKNIPKNEYSILFLKNGKKSLYHPEPIIEPYVYNFVKYFFKDKEKEFKFENISLSAEDLGFELIDLKI